MDISFQCPHCGKKLKASEEQAGSRAKYSKCNHIVQIPKEAIKPQSALGEQSPVTSGHSGAAIAATLPIQRSSVTERVVLAVILIAFLVGAFALIRYVWIVAQTERLKDARSMLKEEQVRQLLEFYIDVKENNGSAAEWKKKEAADIESDIARQSDELQLLRLAAILRDKNPSIVRAASELLIRASGPERSKREGDVVWPLLTAFQITKDEKFSREAMRIAMTQPLCLARLLEALVSTKPMLRAEALACLRTHRAEAIEFKPVEHDSGWLHVDLARCMGDRWSGLAKDVPAIGQVLLQEIDRDRLAKGTDCLWSWVIATNGLDRGSLLSENLTGMVKNLKAGKKVGDSDFGVPYLRGPVACVNESVTELSLELMDVCPEEALATKPDSCEMVLILDEIPAEHYKFGGEGASRILTGTDYAVFAYDRKKNEVVWSKTFKHNGPPSSFWLADQVPKVLPERAEMAKFFKSLKPQP